MLFFPPTALTSFTKNQRIGTIIQLTSPRVSRVEMTGPVHRWSFERALRLRSLFTLVVGLLRRTSPAGFGSAQRLPQFLIEVCEYVLRG